MDENSRTFVIHIAFLNHALRIYPDRKAQTASLLTQEIKISDEYLDFANTFLEEKALVLLERIKFNEHIINLENGKQPFYRPI